jgi:hypothetical protein
VRYTSRELADGNDHSRCGASVLIPVAAWEQRTLAADPAMAHFTPIYYLGPAADLPQPLHHFLITQIILG